MGQSNDSSLKVEGVVLNSVTHKPIPRALVQLDLISQPNMLTGTEGEFSFPNVSAGRRIFTVFKPGFLSGKDATQPAYSKQVMVGPETGRIVLELAPEAVIAGTVLDKNEEPMEGVQVEVLGYKTVHGRQVLFPIGMLIPGYVSVNPMRTDAEGTFRYAMLPAGKYYISARCKNTTQCGAPDNGKNKERIGYPPVTYYPDVMDFDSATAIEIKAGQHVTLPFALKQVPLYSVSGKVRGVQAWRYVNDPVLADARGQLVASADEFDYKTGTFAFKNVPAGAYKVLLNAVSDTPVSSQSKLTIDNSLTGVVLSFATPREIPVIVHKELSKPAPDYSHCTSWIGNQPAAVDCSDLASLTLQLFAADSGEEISSTNTKLKQPRSSQGFSHVMPGRYYVLAQAMLAGGYLASLRCGEVDLLRDELVVPEEGSVPPVEAVFRDDWAGVKIQMRSDLPGQYGWAVLVPKIPGRDPVVLDIEPGVERDYAGIPPGEYTAFIADTDHMNFAEEARAAESIGKAISITLAANSTSTFSLDLIHIGE